MASEQPFNSPSVIHSVFERRAAERGDAIAIRSGEAGLTYSSLNARANKLARHLQKMGVGPEALVAVFLERGGGLATAVLGILKAGGAYVPLETTLPAERIRFVLEDANPRVVITHQNLLAALPECSARVVCLDSDEAAINDESDKNPAASADETGAAYVIYTSGSTGKPKGVIVTHRNVVRLFRSTDHWFQFSEQDVWTLFHSFAFDFSVWEMWGALFYGGTLVIVPHLVSRSPNAFHDLLVREKVTILNQTPSAFRQLIRADQESWRAKDLRLRWVIFGGEALELQSVRPWLEKHGDTVPRLVNMYGITETTVHVTFRPITMEDVTDGRGSVIGQPIPDLSLHILDDQLRPCPVGVPGEIVVGGEGVARGYLRRPELTAERFIPDTVSGKPEARLYRSGDLARRLPDGDLEYLGRIDQQVKIRGFRIELGEIEAALNAHPMIRESVVVAHRDGGEKRLAAYLVSGAVRPGVGELRRHLELTLPDYMMPTHFVFLDALPLTVNGKVDRHALPTPGKLRPELETSFVAPETDAERDLAAIWEEVLGTVPIGVHDNFFALGGDSIRSIQVLARAQQAGFDLSLEQLFANPTVAVLAARVGLREPARIGEDVEPFGCLAPVDRARLSSNADLKDAYPMTKLQAGMIYHTGRDPASAIFHDVFSFRFRLLWDERTLRQAVARLAARQAIFRTSFDLGSFSEPLQLVHRSVTVPLTVDDLRGQTEDDQNGALIEWIELEKRRAFDWSKPPFMRLHVQRREADVFQLIVSFHHVIMDGWSLAAMLTELFQDYAGLLAGQEKLIPPPLVSYRDYVRLEKEVLESDPARTFWRTRLAQAVVSRLPRWPASLRSGGREQVRGPEVVLSRAVLDGLKRLASASGVPLRTVLLAAHCRVMGVLAAQDDVLTGLVSNGRPQIAGGERVIGLFLNTLPFRLEMHGGTWRELVMETFVAERETIRYRRFPLSEIQHMTGGQPLFETVFDFVQFHIYQDLPGYQERSFLEDHYFEANNFTFYQTFMLDAEGAQLQMHCDYDPNELCPAQVQAISDYYANTLTAMARSPEARYELDSPLPNEERRRLLVEWNRTEQPCPARTGVHEMITVQAAKTPDALAVVADDGTFTYAELEARATALAQRLRKLDSGRGKLVGIHMRRSRTMLASVLAVLKSGAAYLPLDPAYPKARLQFMVEDAGLDLILASEAIPELEMQGRTRVLVVSNQAEAGVSGSAFATGQRTESAAFDPEDLAYVIYTSGSTGKPKGIEIPHRALVNLLCSMEQEPGFRSTDTLLAVTTLSFDIAALELFLPLITGGRVVIASRETAMDPLALAAALDEHQISVMQATPTTWRLLVQSGWRGRTRLTALSGGEPLSRELADALVQRCAEVWNLYGPTETTVWSCSHKVERGDGPVPIGRPIANTQVFLLDAHGNLAPTGSTGEICLGGRGLARGYLGRPDLTAQRFVDFPRDGHPVRLYRTGDFGRYLPDGKILCSGRTDHQVKIRGFRVELGEIEAALAAHPAISASVAAVKGDVAGGQKLVAYYIPGAGNLVSGGELRTFLEATLPPQAMPSAFVELAEFPLTPNGKIDRARLPEPAGTQESGGAQFAAPRTPLEEYLAGLWKDVLEVERVGLKDSFFALGGHSLLVIRMIGRIRHELQLDISLRALFENPTLESFARVVFNDWVSQTGTDAVLHASEPGQAAIR